MENGVSRSIVRSHDYKETASVFTRARLEARRDEGSQLDGHLDFGGISFAAATAATIPTGDPPRLYGTHFIGSEQFRTRCRQGRADKRGLKPRGQGGRGDIHTAPYKSYTHDADGFDLQAQRQTAKDRAFYVVSEASRANVRAAFFVCRRTPTAYRRSRTRRSVATTVFRFRV